MQHFKSPEAQAVESIVKAFEEKTGLVGLEYETKERPAPVGIIYVANPTERLYRILDEVSATPEADSEPMTLMTLKKRVQPDLLESAEGRLLLRTLSESLNINRHSFQDDFFSRYTKSVFGAEEQITAAANHVVFGRRGAGKSSLLLYAMHTRSQEERASVWIDMQVYSRRSDLRVVVDVLREILAESKSFLKDTGAVDAYSEKLHEISGDSQHDEARLRKMLPEMRKLFTRIAQEGRDLVVFLDDFHVIDVNLQPRLLGVLYAVARGNNVFLKLSAIETLTKTWNAESREGLEIPQDGQEIKLDYNLTIPDKATEHISSILDAHAVYCGLPSIRKLCTSADVLPRLVWVAAGVPRDALNLFARAMTKATLGGGKRVSVSNINVAASEAINSKLRDLETDASGEAKDLGRLLEQTREFCVKEQKKNALLMEIKTDDPTFKLMQKLVDLRLLHVISEGISVGEAGRKYLALILDYGFYIGIRAARSVDLFNKQTKKVAYKELRRLPKFSI
jgi:hypothetical protein